MEQSPFKSNLLKGLVYLSGFITFTALLFVIYHLVKNGISHLNMDLFALKYTSDNVSLFPALMNTIVIAMLSLVVSIPIGVGASIYLVEYADSQHPLTKVIRIAVETLVGIPSIIYGLFGALFFVKFLKMGISILSGSLILAIMMLPLLMKTSEEALLSVPNTYREGSFALGAGKLRTIMKTVLPTAMQGILGGLILSIGRIVGESAALIFTAGTVAQIATDLFQSGRTLSVHMYAISQEGGFLNQTYASALVLLILVIGMNLLAQWLSSRIGGKQYDIL